MVGKSTPKGSRSEIAAGSRSRSTEALPATQRFRVRLWFFLSLNFIVDIESFSLDGSQSGSMTSGGGPYRFIFFGISYQTFRPIHAGVSTATFLDDPAACANPLTILTVQDVVAVENDPRLTISFAITPEEERLLLLDEVEDTQVTSLLQKLLSGETFGVEDFPGEDTSFCPKNPVPNPVHRRNLRPRKPVDVKIQDISSEEDSEPAVFPCSNGCTYEKMQAFLAAQYEKISTQIKEMERNILIAEEEAAAIIMSELPPTSSDLKPRPNQSGKRRKTVASASVVKTHPYSLRAGGGDRTAAVERPGVEKKVSAKGRAAATLDRLPRQVPCTPTKNPPDHALTPPTCRNLIDQQPQTPSTALILYRDPLCVQPQSYVLPPEVSVPSIFRYGGSPVAWEKTNPHRYRSVGSVRSCHPPRGAKFDSKAKVTSTGSGNVAAPDYIMKAALVIVLDTTNLSLLDAAPRFECRGTGGSPTDVDYSQQEENRHERDLDPLGRGGRKHSIPFKEDISLIPVMQETELITARAGRGLKVGAGSGARDPGSWRECLKPILG
ncbi:hypothetical protein Bca52824_024681 [Brassica carinata]|uniref:Uncharacterized protein n=1 Tax=Brassica carinata TaxID=52824 RepID=A0A8X7VKI9_BRACI|nr:hypothetical protein Bca52824_024681 [Brassica carinata]